MRISTMDLSKEILLQCIVKRLRKPAVERPCVFKINFNYTKGRALHCVCSNYPSASTNVLFCVSFYPLLLPRDFQIDFILLLLTYVSVITEQRLLQTALWKCSWWNALTLVLFRTQCPVIVICFILTKSSYFFPLQNKALYWKDKRNGEYKMIFFPMY